jgi:hypothetical protein
MPVSSPSRVNARPIAGFLRLAEAFPQCGSEIGGAVVLLEQVGESSWNVFMLSRVRRSRARHGAEIEGDEVRG